MKPVISVIIPVYNVEKYIKACLESVLNSEKIEYIELIIINDGSTDNSGAVCKEMTLHYSEQNIKYYEQENQGLSETRNRGMLYATGEYLVFLDSDDMLTDNAIPDLLRVITEKPKVAIFLFDAVIKDEIDNNVSPDKYSRKSKVGCEVISGKEYFRNYYLNPVIVSACMCMYRKEYLENAGLKFAKGKYHEDILFSFKCILMAQYVSYIGRDIYVRRYRENSITTRKISYKHIRDQVDAYIGCIEFLKTIGTIDYGIYNTLVIYWNRSLMYVIESAKLTTGGKALVDEMFNSVLLFYYDTPRGLRGYTFFCGLEELLKCRKNEKIHINNELLNRLYDEYQVRTIEQAMLSIKREIELQKKAILKKIPLQNTNVRIGIYGIGEHTKRLLNDYEEKIGKIEAQVTCIDSFKRSYNSKFLNYNIVNIDDIGNRFHIILLSSYGFHLEMKKKCSEVANREVLIMDLYDAERAALY